MGRKTKGRRQPTGGHAGPPSREKKRAKTAAARTFADLDRSLADLDRERAALVAATAEVAERERAVKAKETAVAKKLQALERDAARREAAEQREQQGVERAAEAAMARLSRETSVYLQECEEQVKPKTGELLCKTQSRMILLLLIALRKEGRSENSAVLQVSAQQRKPTVFFFFEFIYGKQSAQDL